MTAMTVSGHVQLVDTGDRRRQSERSLRAAA
jgi:hypothetical protein